MTISTSLMYWFTRLDGLHNLFEAILILGISAFIVFTIAYIYAFCEEQIDSDATLIKKFASRVLKILSILLIFALSGSTFVPTSKEMAMIYVVPHLAESQVIKQDIPEIYDLGMNALKDWLKDAKKE